MKIINFGSLNIDKVCSVEEFVQPGETIMATGYSVNAGGKGLNQSVAAARAGAQVLHAGAVGSDGLFLKEILADAGADVSCLRVMDTESGCAFIEVNSKGQNRIIVSAGTNRMYTEEYIKNVLEKAEAGDLYFSNIDGWIMYKLTEGKCHLTDYSNASRTQLFNIHTLEWDDDMLELFNIPKSMCPTALPSSGHFCTIERKDFFGGVAVPITGCIGDQQSATFGQCCFEPGMCKMTYGTAGCMLMNIGEEPIPSKNDLLLTIGWGLDGKVEYIYEGTVYNAGSSIQWLRDEMDMIDSTPDSEYYAAKSELPRGYVYVVPAFSGLGAPWYDSYARATIFGLHRGANKYDVIKATLDSLGYQTRDIANAMAKDAGAPIKLLRIDGGAANNNIVAQFVADILGADAERPISVETTAAGAAYLAGLAVGFWKSKEEILACRKIDRLFHPEMPEEEREELYAGWVNCVESLMTWSKKAKQ